MHAAWVLCVLLLLVSAVTAQVSELQRLASSAPPGSSLPAQTAVLDADAVTILPANWSLAISRTEQDGDVLITSSSTTRLAVIACDPLQGSLLPSSEFARNFSLVVQGYARVTFARIRSKKKKKPIDYVTVAFSDYSSSLSSLIYCQQVRGVPQCAARAKECLRLHHRFGVRVRMAGSIRQR
jgi:hypothetical protein